MSVVGGKADEKGSKADIGFVAADNTSWRCWPSLGNVLHGLSGPDFLFGNEENNILFGEAPCHAGKCERFSAAC